MTDAITLKDLAIVAGFGLSVLFGFFVYPTIAARKTMRLFGLTRVKAANGDEIYAATDPDGEPVKVPVARLGKDGKVVVTEEYAPLAYSLPTIAAVQIKASFAGKVGKLTQMANQSALEGMSIDQAANAMALQAFMKGQYGKAVMAYIAPKIAQAINKSGNAGKEAGETKDNGFHPG